MENQIENSRNIFSRLKQNRGLFKKIGIFLAVIAVLAVGYYWYLIGQRVYTDKAEIYAPLILLSPGQPAVLQEIMVKNGEQVSPNQAVAKLDGGELVRAKTEGVIISITNEVGRLFSPGAPIITMIDPSDLRLIAHVPEDKGLSLIHIGQKVIFNVDAFGSKKFVGEVEEMSESADQSSVVFSISDKRVEKDFSIKIKYSYNDYPELLNGMSARAWIYQ